VLNETPRPIRDLKPEISEEFEAVVAKAMAKDAGERYASANDMLADLTSLLEDPTRSTERAKITGPRKKPKKPQGGTKAIVWIAGIAIVIAASVVVATQLMGSATKTKVGAGSGSGSQLATVPPVVDAAVVPPVAVDAAVSTVKVKFESTPPGAAVFLDGADQGQLTPFVGEVVLKEKDTAVTMYLDGYKEGGASFNPITMRKGDDGVGIVSVRLTRLPKGTPNVVRPKNPDDKGKTTPQGPSDKTGGELGGNPYATGSNVPHQ
jgi:hypothetical protein